MSPLKWSRRLNLAQEIAVLGTLSGLDGVY
jgi:hypothetical protein